MKKASYFSCDVGAAKKKTRERKLEWKRLRLNLYCRKIARARSEFCDGKAMDGMMHNRTAESD